MGADPESRPVDLDGSLSGFSGWAGACGSGGGGGAPTLPKSENGFPLIFKS